MSERATEDTCLARRVRMAIPRCKAAQRICRRSGPGPPPTYADWQVATLRVVAVLARRKSKGASYRYLFGRRKGLMKWLGLRTFPGRSTYFDRYRHAYELFQAGVIQQGHRAIGDGLIDPEVVAVDKSLMPARGPDGPPRSAPAASPTACQTPGVFQESPGTEDRRSPEEEDRAIHRMVQSQV